MIGIDIGTSSIKMCQVDIRGGVVYDVYTSVEPVAGTGSDSQLAQKIKSMHKREKNFNSRLIVASVGGSEILLRQLEFPPMPSHELKSSIKLQAEKFIYSDLSDMDLDFHVTANMQTSMEVLLVAAPTSEVERMMQLVQNSGLDPVIVDVDNLALANCYLRFSGSTAGESVILINAGHSITNFIILNGEKFCFAKNVKFGGKDINAEIMKVLEVSEGKASEIKENPDMWDEVGLNIKNVLRKTTPDLLEAVYRSIEYSRSQRSISKIDRILITGGTSKLRGLDGFLGDIFGIETRVWNPLDEVELTQEKDIGPFLSVALGLAVRNKI